LKNEYKLATDIKGLKECMWDIVISILFFIGGLFLITFSSKLAVNNSAALATILGVSPLIIGVSLVSVGTDLPEIFNSIISCYLGHGDIDVGDSVGSDLTQLTLVFGLLPLIVGSFKINRKEIIILGACEILSLIVIYAVVEKGYFTRLNAIVMVSSLLVYFIIIYQSDKGYFEEASNIVQLEKYTKKKSYYLLLAILGFIGIAFSSYLIVNAIITISTLVQVPEYIISFFAASLGTSIPELVTDIRLIRKGQIRMAVGDIVGSCIVDSTLSIGIGQVIFPQTLTAATAVPTILYTLLASICVFVTVSIRRKMDKKTGVFFISLYFLSYLLLLFIV
jgi:cation:H+ antiporter